MIELAIINFETNCTKIIIAHKLETIKHVDEIFYVNAKAITKMDSIEHLVNKFKRDIRSI